MSHNYLELKHKPDKCCIFSFISRLFNQESHTELSKYLLIWCHFSFVKLKIRDFFLIFMLKCQKIKAHRYRQQCVILEGVA